MAQKFYSITEIAAKLDISRQAVHQKIIREWQGQAIAIEIGGRRYWQVPENIVESYKTRRISKIRQVGSSEGRKSRPDPNITRQREMDKKKVRKLKKS